MGKINNWTKTEDWILRKYYPVEGRGVAVRLPGRTGAACSERAYRLGVKGEGPHARGNWTPTETGILREYYPVEGKAVAGRLPGRSAGACYSKAQKLDLKAGHCHKGGLKPGEKARPWTESDIGALRMAYPDGGGDACALLVGRSAQACRAKARALGLRRNRCAWTAEKEEILMREYAKAGMANCAALTGMSLSGCYRKARELGLH